MFIFGETAPPVGQGILIQEVSRSHTQWRTTVGRAPLDECSSRRTDLYLKTHNNHNRQNPCPPVGFEPTISAGERPQTYALDRAVTGTGKTGECKSIIFPMHFTLVICWPSLYSRVIDLNSFGEPESLLLEPSPHIPSENTLTLLTQIDPTNLIFSWQVIVWNYSVSCCTPASLPVVKYMYECYCTRQALLCMGWN